MIAHIRARFSHGVLEPLEPLDLEEGKEVVVSIEDPPAPPSETSSILKMFEEIHNSAPETSWTDLPTDGAKNVKHYLYGWPKDDAPCAP